MAISVVRLSGSPGVVRSAVTAVVRVEVRPPLVTVWLLVIGACIPKRGSGP